MTIHKLIIECARSFFPEYKASIEKWELYNNEMSEEGKSPAYLALYYILSTIVERMGEEAEFTTYREDIQRIVKPFWEMDPYKNKDEVMTELLAEESVEAGSSIFYHKIREAISKNQFSDNDGIPTLKLATGNKKHVAQLLTDLDQVTLTNSEVEQWEGLMASAITSMDDFTADIFDSVSILWMKQASSKTDMICFSHEDVLKMRNIQKHKNLNGYESFRKKDRAETMKRLAALASIWVHVEEDEVQLLDKKDKDFKKTKIKRLFQVDNVTIAHDRKTNEAVGIFECDIRPGDLLASYLYGANKYTGFLSLKALQYNPVHFKYHKRLTRYLSWQWRIRSRKSDFGRPYTIDGPRGLLKVMGMEINEKRPSRTKESFDKLLDTLQKDGVIQSWHYVDSEIESKIGHGYPGWLTNYWLKQTVVISPPSIVISSLNQLGNQPNVNRIGPEVIAEISESLNGQTENEIASTIDVEDDKTTKILDVTSENLKEIRKRRNLSIAKAAAEIGMAHTTLSRWERGLINKPNSKNTEKIKKWLSENQ
jgi:DNA-binding transcriptional regulator YiaG